SFTCWPFSSATIFGDQRSVNFPNFSTRLILFMAESGGSLAGLEFARVSEIAAATMDAVRVRVKAVLLVQRDGGFQHARRLETDRAESELPAARQCPVEQAASLAHAAQSRCDIHFPQFDDAR